MVTEMQIAEAIRSLTPEEATFLKQETRAEYEDRMATYIEVLQEYFDNGVDHVETDFGGGK